MSAFCKIFSTAQLPMLDEYTIEKECITPLELMEGAAEIFAKKMMEFFPEEAFFAVVAGPGNNGGDGFACATCLLGEGKDVKVYEVGSGGGSAERAECRRRYLEAGGALVSVEKAEQLRLGRRRLIVDALFGAGLNRPVTGLYAEVIEAMNGSGLPIVALDMPSGLMGEDNGENGGAITRAVRTITFQFPKLAMMFAENYPYVGEWTAVDIGLHPDVLRETESRYYYLDREGVAARLRMPGKFAHKGTEGHTLLFAGSEKYQGAAALTTRGALRSGAGLVSVVTNFPNDRELRMKVPEALVVSNAVWSIKDRKFVEGFRSVGIGPGIDTSALSAERMLRVLEEGEGVRMVLDADALNLLATHPEWWAHIPPGAVLTPHPKEFERLAGKCANNFERLNKLSTFAQEHDVVAVLKGAHTVVASPDGKCYFNTTGTPGMATGGAGDVLTGVVAALLASGHEPLDAAIVGVYAHGLAGEKAAKRFGVRGMNAGDIAEALGEAWKELEDCKLKTLYR